MTNGLKKEGENNLKNFTIVIGLFIFGCAPTKANLDNQSKGLSQEELIERNSECALYNSFAAGNMQNRDYISAVDNYRYMVEIGCGECECLGSQGEDAEYIYPYLLIITIQIYACFYIL